MKQTSLKFVLSLIRVGMVILLLYAPAGHQGANGRQDAAADETGTTRSLTVPEMLERQDHWPRWARDAAQLQIEGRYEGRTAQAFRFARLPITFQPPRNNPLPDRLREGQRIEVTGRLRSVAGRLVFDVNRLAVGETDIQRLQARTGRVPTEQFDLVYQAADEYQRIAEFYGDRALQVEVEAVRAKAFERERMREGITADELWSLIDRAESLNLGQRTVDEVRFEALAARAASRANDPEAIIRLIEENLSGWDQRNTEWNQQQEQRFQQSAVIAYRRADEVERQSLHRRLYRDIQTVRLMAMLKDDGSNGLLIADELLRLVPEQQQEIARCRQLEIDYGLGRVTRLTRSELQQLADLMKDQGRTAEIPAALDAWVHQQENRYLVTGLAGIVRAADEYLFVAERWNRREHREHGIALLKRAWELARSEAPADAAQIAERLKRFGWERLSDQWMTIQQIRSLPESDVQLAMREGRVVAGMSASQVTGTLGQPAGISRIASARMVRELWIYDAQGSAGIIVHFQRLRSENSQKARVTDVSPLPPDSGNW